MDRGPARWSSTTALFFFSPLLRLFAAKSPISSHPDRRSPSDATIPVAAASRRRACKERLAPSLSSTFNLPTFRPSDLPTFRPSDLPTFRPSDLPTFRPSTSQPTILLAFPLASHPLTNCVSTTPTAIRHKPVIAGISLPSASPTPLRTTPVPMTPLHRTPIGR